MSTAAPGLKRIAVAELRLGMHLHALDGPWLDHPFWRTRFTLTEAADLEALKSSPVRACWIDVEKGQDVAPAAPAPVHAPPPATNETRGAATPPAAPPERPAPVPMAAELQRASALLKRSRGAVEAMFQQARMGKAIDAESCQPLVDDITASVFRNPGALVSLSRLKSQDDYSFMHSVAVCALMVALAREFGFGDDACRQAGLAGLLHDVGKATMPLDVLNKPGKLSDVEMALMRRHPERGHAMLKEGRGAGEAALDVCLHHHERMDGSGYPHRLAGEQITLLARMGAVCDVYDAITSNRPYKAGWDPARSIAQMGSWKGHFDPAVFAAFVKSLGIYPVGSLVRLASGRLAIVTEHDPKSLLTPVVRVFFSTKSNMPVKTELLDLARAAADRIVSRESPSEWGFPRLDELWLGAPPGTGR